MALGEDERLGRLDAVVYTHGHADHILGLDDIRPFNIKQKSNIPLYASSDTLAILRRTYIQSHIDYVVAGVAEVRKNREKIRGPKLTHEAPVLRHFTAPLGPGATGDNAG